MRRYIPIVLLIAYTTLPLVASAKWMALVPETCNVDGGCQSICDLAQLVQNILNDAVILSTFMAAILFAWAGARMLMAAGNPKQIGKAKKTFSAVFIGFVMILTAWLIVDTIMKTFTDQSSNFGPWNKICQ